MAKRVYVPVAKPGQLIARWGRPSHRESPDLSYAWGASGAAKSDAKILSSAFEEFDVYDGKSLRAELEARGYDITTLRFSISQKEPS
jgi:hypothetical protein